MMEEDLQLCGLFPSLCLSCLLNQVAETVWEKLLSMMDVWLLLLVAVIKGLGS